MTKIAHSFRLESLTTERLEKLATSYTENARDHAVGSPFHKSKISKTDVLEFLINKAYEQLEKEEEERWAEKNINKLNS
jgi:cobyrinic acid a,c-diamide synthase